MTGIYANSIKDKTGTRQLASDNGSGWSWGSGVPSGTVVFRSAMTASGVDSADQDTGSPTFVIGFDPTFGPITIQNDYKIIFHISGGSVNYTPNTNYGGGIVYKTGSTFSGATDGTVIRMNYSSSADKQTQTHVIGEATNSSGGALNYYFRACVQSSDARVDCRWFANSTYANRYYWYEIAKV